jgi:hypothetical protein
MDYAHLDFPSYQTQWLKGMTFGRPLLAFPGTNQKQLDITIDASLIMSTGHTIHKNVRNCCFHAEPGGGGSASHDGDGSD